MRPKVWKKAIEFVRIKSPQPKSNERNSIAMVIVTDVDQKNKRYLPHELTTKINSVKLYRQTKDIDFVLRRYHISKASLMRWNRLYDGTFVSFEIPSKKRTRLSMQTMFMEHADYNKGSLPNLR